MILPSNSQYPLNPIYLENPIEKLPNDFYIEDSTENFGKTLADTWLQLAKNHEKNTLNNDPTFIKNIISNINGTSPETLQITDQNFLQRIASFSESERSRLIKFFVDTIHPELENCWFYLFIQLGQTLESATQKNALNVSEFEQRSDDQIIKDVFSEMEAAHAYNEKRLSETIAQLPKEIFFRILDKNPRKSEICKEFVIRNTILYENPFEHLNNFKVSEAEENLLDCITKKLKETTDFNCNKPNLIEFIIKKIKTNEISIDSLNLKDEALNYVNLQGEIPVNELQDILKLYRYNRYHYENFFHWLGRERVQKIKKLQFLNDPLRWGISVRNLVFICPHLEELDLKYQAENNTQFDQVKNKMSHDFEWISLCKNLKTLKLSNFTIDALIKLLKNIATSNTNIESIELDYSDSENLEIFNNLCYLTKDIFRYQSSQSSYYSIEETLENFKKLPIIESVKKLTIKNLGNFKFNFKSYGSNLSDLGNGFLYKNLFSKMINISELNIFNSKKFIVDKVTPHLKNLKKLNYHNCNFSCWDNAFWKAKELTKLTHLSFSNCMRGVRTEIACNFDRLNLKSLYENNVRIPLRLPSIINEHETEIKSSDQPLTSVKPSLEKFSEPAEVQPTNKQSTENQSCKKPLKAQRITTQPTNLNHDDIDRLTTLAIGLIGSIYLYIERPWPFNTPATSFIVPPTSTDSKLDLISKLGLVSCAVFATFGFGRLGYRTYKEWNINQNRIKNKAAK